jgi:hypothetical protein
MKRLIILTYLLPITLISCISGALPTPIRILTPEPIIELTITPGPILPLSSTTPPETNTDLSTLMANFNEPDPATWVMLMKPVREYFYYRKKAVVSGKVEILWDRYPGLKQPTDFSKGINKEAFFVENMKGLKPFDGNIFPETYERIKVIISNRQAEVLVHGTELYLYLDKTGQFDDSGGELKIILFMSSRDNLLWTVYKTEDISGP